MDVVVEEEEELASDDAVDVVVEEVDDEVDDVSFGFSPSARAFCNAATKSFFSKKLLVEIP